MRSKSGGFSFPVKDQRRRADHDTFARQTTDKGEGLNGFPEAHFIREQSVATIAKDLI